MKVDNPDNIGVDKQSGTQQKSNIYPQLPQNAIPIPTLPLGNQVDQATLPCEELVLVKMAAMRQVEHWFMDFKKIMDMVLRSGEIQLWVSRLGMGWLGG